MLVHKVFNPLIALCFYLEAPNMRTAVLCLTSNFSKSWWGGFIALGFITVTYWLGDIGLLLEPPSVVETIHAWIMALYCCWSSHFPEFFIKFLMFSRHLCSYIALLINDWLNPTVYICFFSHSFCNNLLIVTHSFLNDSTAIVKSITLVNARDLAHYAAWAISPLIWKLRYSFPGGGSFLLGLWVVLLSWYLIYSDPKKTWALGAVTLWLFYVSAYWV